MGWPRDVGAVPPFLSCPSWLPGFCSRLRHQARRAADGGHRARAPGEKARSAFRRDGGPPPAPPSEGRERPRHPPPRRPHRHARSYAPGAAPRPSCPLHAALRSQGGAGAEPMIKSRTGAGGAESHRRRRSRQAAEPGRPVAVARPPTACGGRGGGGGSGGAAAGGGEQSRSPRRSRSIRTISTRSGAHVECRLAQAGEGERGRCIESSTSPGRRLEFIALRNSSVSRFRRPTR